MKYLLILCLTPGLLRAQTSKKKYPYFKPPVLEYYLKSNEQTRYAFFKFDFKRDSYIGFDKNSKPSSLSANDLIKIERLIRRRVADYNKVTRKKYGEGGSY